MKCPECRRGFCDTCLEGECDCSHAKESPAEVTDSTNEASGSESVPDQQLQTSNQPKRKRRQKPDFAVRDQQSTGRKRAARLYPLDPEATCEWANTYGQGGGSKPIYGCNPLTEKCKQLARHHGPDKNTLNNEPGNVHRIGHICHNRWHAANDPDYDPNNPILKD